MSKTTGPHGGSGGDDQPLNDLRHTINEGLRILYLRRWLFVVPFCLVAAAGFVASYYIPRTYKSSIIFERRSDPIIADLLSASFTSSSFDTMQRTISFDIKGTDAMVKAVCDVGLYDHLSKEPGGNFDEEAMAQIKSRAKQLSNMISLRWWERSPNLDMIEIQYMGPDQGISRNLLTAMMDNYANHTQQRITEILNRAKSFLVAEAEDRQARLDEVDREMLQFKIDYPGVNPSDPDGLHFKITSLESRRRQLQDSIAQLSTQLESQQEFLRGRLSQADKDDDVITPANQETVLKVEPPKFSRRAMQLRASMEQVVQDARTMKAQRGMTDEHPEMVALYRYRDRLEEELAVELVSPSDAQPELASATTAQIADRMEASTWELAKAQAETEIRKLQRLKSQASRDAEDVESELQFYNEIKTSLFARRQEFEQKLQRSESIRADLAFWRRNIEQVDHALLAEDKERGVKFAFVEGPTGGIHPYTPQSGTVIMLCLVAGAAAGVACVLLAELFDRRFRTAAQVARSLGIPVLESIDEIVTPVEKRKRFLRNAFVVPPVIAMLLALVLYSGTLAYLSLERPALFERMSAIPRSMMSFFVENGASGRIG